MYDDGSDAGHRADSMRDSNSVSWGPATWVGIATALAAPAALVWLLLDRNDENRIVAGALVVVCTLTATALARMKSRLRATDEGIVVTGPLHTRQIAWAQLASIATPQSGRFGRRGASLELEIRPPEPPTEDDGERGDFRDPTLSDPTVSDVGPGDPDLSDTELLAFGAFDLGADPAQVGRTLLRLHRRYEP